MRAVQEVAHPAAARQVGLAPRLLHLLDEPLAAPAELSHTGRRLGRLDDEAAPAAPVKMQ